MLDDPNIEHVPRVELEQLRADVDLADHVLEALGVVDPDKAVEEAARLKAEVTRLRAENEQLRAEIATLRG